MSAVRIRTPKRGPDDHRRAEDPNRSPALCVIFGVLGLLLAVALLAREADSSDAAISIGVWGSVAALTVGAIAWGTRGRWFW
ncbi:hypothetical protein Lesp01_88470 [Lentzea sp. NBRC 102530]|nr:hypothetical protein Lesp01_88470 [Lentzea sp. NBRC 102530]